MAGADMALASEPPHRDLGLFRHAVGRPRRVEHHFHVDRADTVDAGAGDDYIQVYLLNSGAADHTLTLGSGRDEVDIRSTTSTSCSRPMSAAAG